MAVDYFLKIDGVKGESQDDKHKDEIQIMSFNWGASNSSSMQIASGGGVGRADVRDIVVKKYMDLSSPLLAQSCISGKHFASMVLTGRRQGETPLEHVIIKLTNAIVSGYEIGGGLDDLSADDYKGDGPAPFAETELVKFNFEEYSFKYVQQTDKGGAGSNVQQGWNVRSNKKV
jgi:type VI secretion system secreted protein Hcp